MGVAQQVQDALESEAYIRGRRAGKLTLSPSLNEYQEGTPEHAQWLLGWQTSSNEAAAYANQRIYSDRLTRWDGDARMDRAELRSTYGRAA